MNDKLKEAFGQIQADEELKNKTKEFIFQKTKGYTQAKTVNYRHFIPVVACMVLILFGGRWLYFTPTVEISIDINPSMELGVNRFDRVISVKSYNDDGQELIDSLDIKYMNYAEGIDQILQNDNIAALLSNGEIMTIGVIGTEGTQSSDILSGIESCTAGEKNTYCYYAHSEEAETAHEMGLSCGKYRAFLELQELAPNITAEEIQNMTMREIRDLINTLSSDNEDGIDDLGNSGHESQESCQENGQGEENNQGEENDQGHGNGQGEGNGQGHGNGQGEGNGQGYGNGYGQGNGQGYGNGHGQGNRRGQ